MFLRNQLIHESAGKMNVEDVEAQFGIDLSNTEQDFHVDFTLLSGAHVLFDFWGDRRRPPQRRHSVPHDPVEHEPAEDGV